MKARPPLNALAYSYLRFSSPAQADGDSVRRQTTLRDAWLKRHPGVRLDESLAPDKGVSGYRGEHRTNRKHGLAQFLDQVERGRVPAGSYLIVENLDRLTREEPEVSIPLVMNLIRAGILIVQLAPTEMVYEPGMDFGRLMMMLWELARGNSESKRKSGLLGEAWQAKKEQARADKTPYGRMCPAWLELADGKYRIKADAARAVRKIFAWCADGLGAFAILHRLNQEQIKPIGRSGKWDRSYVMKIIKSVAAIGVYQPCVGSRRRKAEGDPVADYYPAVVREQLFYAAQAAMKSRKKKSGRPATDSGNPFSGLLYCAKDGSKLHVSGTRGYKYLVSADALMKRPGSRWQTFPLRALVPALLSELQELKASDLFSDPGAAKVAELTGRLGEVETKLARARERFDADPESTTWDEMVTKYDLEKRALVRDLAEAKQEAANPVSAAWAEAVELIAQKEPARLRAALLATITGVWCLFVNRGTDRLCAAQVWFAREQTKRDYLVYYRQTRANAAACIHGGWQVRSLADDTKIGPLDLRVKADAEKLAKALADVPLDGLV